MYSLQAHFSVIYRQGLQGENLLLSEYQNYTNIQHIREKHAENR